MPSEFLLDNFCSLCACVPAVFPSERVCAFGARNRPSCVHIQHLHLPSAKLWLLIELHGRD